MSFSIVIPSRTADNVIPCIKAVRESGHAHRIIVVDDGIVWPEFDVHSPDFDKYPMDGVTSVAGEKPFVFARNCNIGIRAAGDDDVILLNDDAILRTPDGFSQLSKVAQHEDIGILAAVTNITGQPLQWPKGVGLRQVPHFAFVCVYIPRRTIERVGMLDERYCIDYGVEDRDYCEAVNRAGLKCSVYDFCYVDHGSLVSTFRGDPKTPRSFTENHKLFQQKWGIR